MEETKIRRIILAGKAASGKDHARKDLQELGLTYGVSYTTRKPRATEEEGKDYYFLSEEEFQKNIDDDVWFEYVQFNGWNYGTTKNQFNRDCEIFIMTPVGLSHLNEKERSESLVIFLDISFDVRKKRLLERSDNDDSMNRRLAADEVDFMEFTDWDVKVNDHKFNMLEQILIPAINEKQITFNEHIINKLKKYEYQT